MACLAHYFHKFGSTIFIHKLDLLKAFCTLGQLQYSWSASMECRSARLNACSFAIISGLREWIDEVILGRKLFPLFHPLIAAF
jgi:hypothetical protein